MTTNHATHANLHNNRVVARLTAARAERRIALMPFICAGHPSIESTSNTLLALDRAGADVIEIGIPFSDPIADGPVIAGAMHEAIQRGVTWQACFEQVHQARQQALAAAVVAMVSMSIVLRVGIERFTRAAADAGIDGLIIPDTPLEEAPIASAAAHNVGLINALLVAPTTPIDRARQIAAASSGFVYVVARAGVTGDNANPDLDTLDERLQALRTVTDLPLAVGFGIAKREHVQVLESRADAAIVGSALVRVMAAAADPANAAADLLTSLRPASATA